MPRPTSLQVVVVVTVVIVLIYREKVSSSKKKADEESSPLYLGYHFLYKNPKLFGFRKPEEEEEGKKKRAKESEYVVFLTLLDRR